VRGKRVIDVPCGTGWGTAMLAGARSIVGIDVSLEAVAYARKRFGRKVMFVVGGMDRIPLGAAGCEVVLCLEGIEHVPEDVGAAFVSEAARVLAPGGEIIVTSPLPDPQRAPNPYHVHEYTAEELARLMGSRFEPIRSVIQDVEGVQIVYYVVGAAKNAG
jgi:ubiquinone/menaquinone biosynthesis C-methylase UbiE